MNASETAKKHGARSVAWVGRIANVPTRTLFDWHTTKPKLFEIICKGAVVDSGEKPKT